MGARENDRKHHTSDKHRHKNDKRGLSEEAEEGELGDQEIGASPVARNKEVSRPPSADDLVRDTSRRDRKRRKHSADRSPSHRRSNHSDRRRRSRSRSRSPRRRHRRDDRGHYKKEEDGEEDEEEYQARVAAALGNNGEDDEEKLIEERRRKRQEILAKYKQQQGGVQDGAPVPLVSDPSASGPRGAEHDSSDDEDAAIAELGVEEGGTLNIWGTGVEGAAEAGPAVAAPDASGIGEADDTELQQRVKAHLASKPEAEQPGSAAPIFSIAPSAIKAAAADADDDDDDGLDMFADTPDDVRAAREAAAAAPAMAAATSIARPGLQDNYDDADGYYNFQVGEMVGGRYEVFATHGRGVFSSVLRARDIGAVRPEGGPPPEVAIKVIRSNDTMYKAGQMEKVILRKLGGADPEGKRHCIRLLGSFEYRHHLCLVFEPMDMNLRELTKRYGRGIGLSISAVRIYAQQMLVSLYHLKNCGVLHADIKPDNILVNDRRTVVKLCDFGSAMFSGDNEITPYLCSRFYRAPEVILGLPYDHPMDMWSIGCVVYELLTGRILFPGKTNNEMLKLMMDVKGPFPKKMLKRGEFVFKHFESDATIAFALLEEDKLTKRPIRRLIANPTMKNDFGALLAGQSPDRIKLAQLVDLLERMMALDPDKRISPKDALRHPFIKNVAVTPC